MENQKCKNCDQPLTGNFCSNCGQNAHEHRINAHYFLHDIPHSVFHVDGGFFYTIKMLFTNPGLMIEEYLDGKRVKYFRPIAYVMVMTAFSALLVKFLDWCKGMILNHFHDGIALPKSANFFESYFSVFIFLMIPIASLLTWLFFVKGKYNYWEHFLANTYIAAQLNFMWILMHLLGMIVAVFSPEITDLNYGMILTLFLAFFLFLYGYSFGYLMRKEFKLYFLIPVLFFMNVALSFLYAMGFRIVGLI